MKWIEAVRHADQPTVTNRDASGLIGFARAAVRTFAKDAAMTPWDWYAFALPALGWAKPGDRFKVDIAWQLQPYSFATQLRKSLLTMADELDAASVPFRVLVDPRGTDKGYRQLALDAWAAMKQLGQEASKLPDDQKAQLVGTWAAQVGPQAAAVVASSASAAAAAAAAPKKTPTTEPKEEEQLPLPGVPQVMPPPGTKTETEPTYEAQPVTDKPSSGGGGGGAGLLLLAAAFLFGRKKRRKG